MNSRIYSTAEVATFFGVADWRIRRLFEDGTLPEPGRIAGRRVVPESRLGEIAEALRTRGWLARQAGGRPMSGADAISELLRPLVSQAVAETLARMQAADARLGSERLALNEHDAASALGVTPKTIANLRYAGKLHGTKVGRSWCYSVESLRGFPAEGGAA